jgi:RNase P subunit RPR2
MTYEDAPACDRHEAKVPMELRTMHSDESSPDVVLGLFECPECGYERRFPIQTKDAA